MKKFRYKNLLIFPSFQFCGNIVEYFSANTEKLVAFYIMPRKGLEPNMLRIYNKGKLIYERILYSPKNFLLCYLFLYLHFIWILFRFFSKGEMFYVVSGHPLFSMGKSVWGIFRKYDIAYFVADYYPGRNVLNVLYRTLSRYYHDNAAFKFYISDRLNAKMNGEVKNSETVKTIMWGVDPPKFYRKSVKDKIVLCFIGAIRESHGLPRIFSLLKKRTDVAVKILGTCEKTLFRKYQSMVNKYKIANQVYFPNKFMEYLDDEVKDCDVGVAFYEVNSGTYFADPGKVKAYMQYGLPVLMTDAAEIAEYLKSYHAGVIVDEDAESIKRGIEELKKNYNVYQNGLKKLNKYFNYKTYYPKRYRFLEKE